MQHYFHCLSAHKLQNLLHADTVTTLSFPNDLNSLPVPLCLSALLPLYSQITAIAPTQSLHYRIKEQLENKYSFPLSPPSDPYRTLIPTWNPRRKLWQMCTLVSAQHTILVINQTEINLSPSNIRGTVDLPPISDHSPHYHYTCRYHDIETT